MSLLDDAEVGLLQCTDGTWFIVLVIHDITKCGFPSLMLFSVHHWRITVEMLRIEELIFRKKESKCLTYTCQPSSRFLHLIGRHTPFSIDSEGRRPSR